jgi:hypothetical protein
MQLIEAPHCIYSKRYHIARRRQDHAADDAAAITRARQAIATMRGNLVWAAQGRHPLARGGGASSPGGRRAIEPQGSPVDQAQ